MAPYSVEDVVRHTEADFVIPGNVEIIPQ
jgi:hypothetical protein